MKKTVALPFFRRRWQRRELVVLALLFMAPVAAGLLSPVLAVEAVFLAGGAFFVMILLRGNWSLFGPHFYYDIIRLARRGRSTNVRIMYLAALLVCLGYVYFQFFSLPAGDFMDQLFGPSVGVPINTMARLAETFVGTILIVQNLAVLLITPAYVATAISEERERRTLGLLFATQLKDREIVLGKLMARLVHMGGVLLAGLPILSLAQFFGGIDMFVLLTNFVITALNLWTVGVVCIMTSALARSALTAVLASYGILIPIALALGCITASLTRSVGVFVPQYGFDGGYEHLLEILGALLIMHGMVSGLCLSMAIHNVRTQPEFEADATMEIYRDFYPLELGVKESSRDELSRLPLELWIVKRDHHRCPRAVSDDPLLWKEMHTGWPLLSPIFWLPLASVLFPLAIMYLAAICSAREMADENWRALRGLALALSIGLGVLYCVGSAFRASVGVARERQQATLDGLLTLPVTSNEVLYAKWLGALLKGWPWLAGFAVVVLLGLAGGAFHVVGAVLLVLAVLIHAAFVAALGVFLSVISRTVLAAQTRMALILFLLFVLNLLAVVASLLSPSEGWGNFCMCLNPPVCWYVLCQGPREIAGMSSSAISDWLQAIYGSLFAYVAMGALLWWLAARLFAMERFRRRE